MRDVYVDENLSSRGYEVNRRISPGFFLQKHWHEGVELLIVHSGVVEFYCDDRRELCVPESLLVERQQTPLPADCEQALRPYRAPLPARAGQLCPAAPS